MRSIAELSVVLVETYLHNRHSFIYELLKLVMLLLPVAIASVERTFLAMKLCKKQVKEYHG